MNPQVDMRWAMQFPPTAIGIGHKLLEMPNPPWTRLLHARAVAQNRKLSMLAAEGLMLRAPTRPRFR
jgi:hypothetical protein